MKSLLALLTIALLGVGVTACGGTGKRTGSASQVSSNAATTAGVPARTASGATPAEGSLEGDEDDDDTAESYTPNKKDDRDDDFDNNRERENTGYLDSDDNGIRNYGHAASAADTQAVTALVKRYYAAAAAGDGVMACSMLVPSLARTTPEDYGQAPGPAYLRGAKSCQAVMSRLFKHVHTRLSGAIAVTGVRVNANNQALAFVGSKVMPASEVSVNREGGAWKVDSMIGAALP